MLNYLRSFDLWLVCLSKDVTGTLRNPSASLLCDSFSFCVSVQRRDRCTVSLLRSLLHLHSVSVRRRDRSLSLSLLCSTKVQFFDLSQIRSFTFDLFLDNFSLLLHSVSVQRRGRCSVSSLRFRSLIIFYLVVYCFFCTSLSVFGFSFVLFRSFFTSVTYFGSTVCLSKDVTGALLPTHFTQVLSQVPSFSVACLFFPSFSLSPPRFWLSLIWVLPFNISRLSVQRRDRYTSLLFLSPPLSTLSFLSHLSHTNPLHL